MFRFGTNDDKTNTEIHSRGIKYVHVLFFLIPLMCLSGTNMAKVKNQFALYSIYILTAG